LHAWLQLPVVGRCVVLVVALLLGLAMPVMGGSLLLFMLVDALRWQRKSQPVNAA
ncbi:PepSY domain-containing protein, partial [Escherichia coli]